MTLVLGTSGGSQKTKEIFFGTEKLGTYIQMHFPLNKLIFIKKGNSNWQKKKKEKKQCAGRNWLPKPRMSKLLHSKIFIILIPILFMYVMHDFSIMTISMIKFWSLYFMYIHILSCLFFKPYLYIFLTFPGHLTRLVHVSMH